MTPLQQDPSAQAPWTSTMFGRALMTTIPSDGGDGSVDPLCPGWPFSPCEHRVNFAGRRPSRLTGCPGLRRTGTLSRVGHVDLNGISFTLPDGRPLLDEVTF